MVWRERVIRERREMTKIPKDPVMLLSYINTQLRDNYPDMDELCRSLCLDRKDVDEKLASIDYEYDLGKNQYVSMETIEKICKKLDCTVDEMMDFTDDE